MIPDANVFAQYMSESEATRDGKSETRMRTMELKQATTDAVSNDGNGGGSSFKDLG